MASGHDAKVAEWWAAQCDGRAEAPDRAIDLFASANAAYFAEIAEQDLQPWKMTDG
jgi:hypothetical protein